MTAQADGAAFFVGAHRAVVGGYKVTSVEPTPSPLTGISIADLEHRSALRQSLRKQRNSLRPQARRDVAIAIARRVSHAQLLRPGHAIAVYLAFDGEVDLTPLAARAVRAGCRIFVPRITDMRRRRMEFVALDSRLYRLRVSRSLVSPRIGLDRQIDARKLDVILLPLVAFDMHGWRLGFGAGFYDRKLAFARHRFVKRPLLIGVGYDFQRVQSLSPAPWDVPLHAIVTERGLYRCRPRAHG